MLSVAAEKLIRTLAGERDLDMPRRQLAQREETQGREIGKRLVQVPDELGEVDGVVDEGELELMVIRSEVPGNPARVRELVLGTGLGKAHRKGLHRLAHLLRHQGDDQARVESPTQHRAQGDIAHQA